MHLYETIGDALGIIGLFVIIGSVIVEINITGVIIGIALLLVGVLLASYH